MCHVEILLLYTGSFVVVNGVMTFSGSVKGIPILTERLLHEHSQLH
jgi:hypothetical protein